MTNWARLSTRPDMLNAGGGTPRGPESKRSGRGQMQALLDEGAAFDRVLRAPHVINTFSRSKLGCRRPDGDRGGPPEIIAAVQR